MSYIFNEKYFVSISETLFYYFAVVFLLSCVECFLFLVLSFLRILYVLSLQQSAPDVFLRTRINNNPT